MVIKQINMKRIVICMMALLAVVSTGCKKDKIPTKPSKKCIVLVDGEKIQYKPGGLASVLEGKNVTSLKWTDGSITADDIAAIREHCISTLLELDMSQAYFANNGSKYIVNGNECFVKEPTTVPNYMCQSFTKLESVVLPSSTKIIGLFAFAACTSLKNFEMSDNLEEIGGYAFMGAGMESITFSKNLTSVGIEAFYGVPLKEITLPASIRGFYDDSFVHYQKVSKLEKVTCLATTPPRVDDRTSINKLDNVFGLTPEGFKILVPKKSLEAYKTADRWKAHAAQIEAFD